MSYVVVLILNYNGKGLLEECLSSYLSNDYHNFDVVLIDNGSYSNQNRPFFGSLIYVIF